MPKELFKSKKFKGSSLEIIGAAQLIIEEYQEQGFSLTLRQLYYQFVARDWLPNKQSEYKRLGSIINDARLAGLIDWHSIEDRTRFVRSNPFWDSPEKIIESCANQFKIDVWEHQTYRPEVWIEKDALVGVIEPICSRLNVPFFACRGYSSQSEQWRAGKRFEQHILNGQCPIVFHLGDHDPSGIDMTRDNRDRLGMFAYENVSVNRLALNMDQIEEHNPPPNPAKETDSRAGGYISRYGASSWELDALNPKIINDLIENAVNAITDQSEWKRAHEEQETHKKLLKKCANHWGSVKEVLGY